MRSEPAPFQAWRGIGQAAVLWSAEFKGETSQLLSIQNRIVNQIASAVTLRPAPKEKVAVRYSQNPEAYDLYLRGEYFLTRRSHTDVEYDLYKAVEYFNQAVDKDQNFALAHAALADAYNKLSWYLPADQSLAKAKAAAQRALALDPNLAPAYRALASFAPTIYVLKTGLKRIPYSFCRAGSSGRSPSPESRIW